MYTWGVLLSRQCCYVSIWVSTAFFIQTQVDYVWEYFRIVSRWRLFLFVNKKKKVACLTARKWSSFSFFGCSLNFSRLPQWRYSSVTGVLLITMFFHCRSLFRNSSNAWPAILYLCKARMVRFYSACTLLIASYAFLLEVHFYFHSWSVFYARFKKEFFRLNLDPHAIFRNPKDPWWSGEISL